MTQRLLYYDGKRPQAHVANLVVNTVTESIGIGTTTPTNGFKLDVTGVTGTGIRIGDSSNSSSFRTQWTNDTATITAAKDGSDATRMNFFTQAVDGNTSNTLHLYNSNVGVGTTNPLFKLDTRLTVPSGTEGPTANSYPIASFIGSETGGGSRGLEIGVPTGGIISPVYLKVSGTSANFAILNQSDVQNFTLTSGGNVGIGTDGPLDLLQLRSTSATAYDATVDTGQYGNGAGITITNMDQTNESFAQVNMQVSGASGRALGRIVTIRKGSATSDMAFVTENSGVISEKMRIASGGNVGIGTTNPARTLHVNSLGGQGIVAFQNSNVGCVIQANGSDLNQVEIVGYTQDLSLQTNGGGNYSNILLRQFASDSTGIFLTTRNTGSTNAPFVGIGTNTPANYQLHIVRKAGTTGNLLLDGDTSVSGNPKIIFRDINTSNVGILDFNDTANSFTFSRNLIITGSGTSVPGQALDVNGTVRSRLGAFQLNDGTNTGGGLYFLKTISGGGSSLAPALFAETGLELYFFTNGTVGTSRMTISTTGTVTIPGTLSKGSGSFKIDHPLPAKTDTHHLVHSFIEGPQADLIYRGKIQLVNGTATVNIDTIAGMTEGTFTTLNRDIQCFTSNETDWDAVKGSVSGNILTIECQNASSTATISWMVIGERQDKHMYDTELADENGKIIVEPLKNISS